MPSRSFGTGTQHVEDPRGHYFSAKGVPAPYTSCVFFCDGALPGSAKKGRQCYQSKDKKLRGLHPAREPPTVAETWSLRASMLSRLEVGRSSTRQLRAAGWCSKRSTLGSIETCESKMKSPGGTFRPSDPWEENVCLASAFAYFPR